MVHDPNTPAHTVTVLLAEWRKGSRQAESKLLALLQPELRRIAANRLRRERPNHTLQPTALVNEAYVRLVGQHRVDWQDRGHFLAIAAREMRRILVDHARKRRAAKRGAGERQTISLDEHPAAGAGDDVDILSLHEALSDLSTMDAPLAGLVELRYFGGLTITEIAKVRGESMTTVKRQLSIAKLWLKKRLTDGPSLQR